MGEDEEAEVVCYIPPSEGAAGTGKGRGGGASGEEGGRVDVYRDPLWHSLSGAPHVVFSIGGRIDLPRPSVAHEECEGEEEEQETKRQ